MDEREDMNNHMQIELLVHYCNIDEVSSVANGQQDEMVSAAYST